MYILDIIYRGSVVSRAHGVGLVYVLPNTHHMIGEYSVVSRAHGVGLVYVLPNTHHRIGETAVNPVVRAGSS